MTLDEIEKKEYLTTGEALRFCRAHGWTVSIVSLYYQGLHEGFARKTADGYHWEFSRRGLSQFLLQKNLPPPPGYVTVSELAAREGSSPSTLYTKLKRWGVPMIKLGPLKRLYVCEVEYVRRKNKI